MPSLPLATHTPMEAGQSCASPKSVFQRCAAVPFGVQLAILGGISILTHAAVFAVSLRDPIATQIVPDSQGYMTLAQNLVAKRAFARFVPVGDAFGHRAWLPELVRTPGYPGFLAVFYMLRLDVPATVTFAQHILLIGIYLIAVLVCRRQHGPAAGLICAALLAVDLHGAILANVLLSESLFGVLYLAGFLLITHAYRAGSAGEAMGATLIAGLVLAVASLVKPASVAIVATLAVLMLLHAALRRSPMRLAIGMIFLVSSSAPILAWMYRNERETGQFAVWSLPRYQLLFEHAAWAMAVQRDISIEDAREHLAQQAGVPFSAVRFAPLSTEVEREMRWLALETIRHNPSGFAWATAVRTLNTLAGPDKTILTIAGLEWTSFGLIEETTPPPARPILMWSLLLPQSLHVALVYCLIVGAGVSAWKRRAWPARTIIGLVLAAGLLAVSAGSPGDPRYRWPAIPVLIVASVAALGDDRAGRTRFASARVWRALRPVRRDRNGDSFPIAVAGRRRRF